MNPTGVILLIVQSLSAYNIFKLNSITSFGNYHVSKTLRTSTKARKIFGADITKDIVVTGSGAMYDYEFDLPDNAEWTNKLQDLNHLTQFCIQEIRENVKKILFYLVKAKNL